MINLKQNIIRQLNQIYGISFQEKYKEEIKERILFFINKKFEEIKFNNLSILKEYIEMENFNISRIKELFIKENKEELLKSFNPLWYKERTKVILTEGQIRYAKAIILNNIIEQAKEKIDNEKKKYRINSYKISDNLEKFYNIDKYSLIINKCYFKIKKEINKNIKYIERKKDKEEVLLNLKSEIKQIKEEVLEVLERLKAMYNKENEEKIMNVILLIKNLKNKEFSKIEQKLKELQIEWRYKIFNYEMCCILEEIIEKEEKECM